MQSQVNSTLRKVWASSDGLCHQRELPSPLVIGERVWARLEARIAAAFNNREFCQNENKPIISQSNFIRRVSVSRKETLAFL